jgi:hypothetical protein
MYYGCYGFAENGTETCLATSKDGMTWTDAPVGSAETFNLGQVLFGAPGAWDAAHETPYAVQRGANTYLYYTGYDNTADGFFGTDSASIGLATASDGVTFSAGNKVLEPTPGGLDDHGLTSPTVFPWKGGWGMTYTGWCLESATVCPRLDDGLYVAQMGAVSRDGITWTKLGTNLVPDDTLPEYGQGGIAESHVFQVPDGRWAMLHMGLTPDEHHAVGIALGPTPFGPWRFRADPLITSSDLSTGWPNGEASAVAPHARIERDRIKIWFAGEAAGFRIGYAEGDWPLAGTMFAPTAPQQVKGSAQRRELHVRWQAPADTGGSRVSQYRIEYSTGNDVWIDAGVSRSTSAKFRVKPSDVYLVRVSGVNETGQGEWSTTAQIRR